MVKGLAAQMLKKGIRVNCVAPGPVWTPLIVSSYSAEQTTQHGASVCLRI
jgi:NAD(P)-dependent dehydrogenase (short-subunit alcohol dehydrogenase family)